MQFKSLAFAALAGVALAAPEGLEKRQGPVDPALASVLITALPASVVQLAATNQAALSSQIAAALSAGQTPDWIKALPASVQSQLLGPMATAPGASMTGSAAASVSSMASGMSSAASASDMSASMASASSASDSSASSASASSSKSASSASAASTGSTSKSTGGAAAPTAVVGAGLAGALGMVGLLVL